MVRDSATVHAAIARNPERGLRTFTQANSCGAVLAFMMAVIGLSFPEMVILRKVLRPRLIATFAVVVGVGILIVGYLFNLLAIHSMVVTTIP